MCVFSATFQLLPDFPLLVLANRDESRARPTEPPQCHAPHDATPWIGGLDRQARGTWLGINAAGLLVAVTNRAKTNLPENVRSRGLLCRELLAHPSVDDARSALDDQLRRHHFAGFNLLLFSAEQAMVIEAGDKFAAHVLAPGIHTIANAGLNDPVDPRVARAQFEVNEALARCRHADDWIEAARPITALHAADQLAGLCLHRNGWGTVSSTLLVLAAERVQSRYLYAAGSPCTTPFTDYSPLLRSLLTEETR